jgi:hypothetical protein
MGSRNSLRQPIDTNQVGIEFLLTELDTGLVFLKVAAAAKSAERVLRNRENARLAYNTVLRFLPIVKLGAEERKVFDQKLAELKAQLDACQDLPPSGRP